MTNLNDQIVTQLLEWQQARAGLARGPQAHALADRLIATVREHDRPMAQQLSAADARATIRMLEAFKRYLNVVDALSRALREADMAIGGAGLGDMIDPADIRNELTVLIKAFEDSATGSKTTPAAPPVPSPRKRVRKKASATRDG